MPRFSEGFNDTGDWSKWTKVDYYSANGGTLGSRGATASVSSGTGILTTTTDSNDYGKLGTICYRQEEQYVDGEIKVILVDLHLIGSTAIPPNQYLTAFRYDGHTSTPTGYYVGITSKDADFSGAATYFLYKSTASTTLTLIASGSLGVPASGGYVRVRFMGDTISFSYGTSSSTLVTVTDTSISAAGYVGIGYTPNTTTSSAIEYKYDEFEFMIPDRGITPILNVVASAATAGVSSTTFTTASFTMKANTPYFIWAVNTRASASSGDDLSTSTTLTGTTFTKIDSATAGARRATIWQVSSTSTSTGTITFTAPTNANNAWAYIVLEVSNGLLVNVALSATIVEQSSTTAPTAVTGVDPQNNMLQPHFISNGYYITFAASSQTTVPTVEGGWTAISGCGLTTSGTGTPNISINAAYRALGDRVVSWTGASSNWKQWIGSFLLNPRTTVVVPKRQAVGRGTW